MALHLRYTCNHLCEIMSGCMVVSVQNRRNWWKLEELITYGGHSYADFFFFFESCVPTQFHRKECNDPIISQHTDIRYGISDLLFIYISMLALAVVFAVPLRVLEQMPH